MTDSIQKFRLWAPCLALAALAMCLGCQRKTASNGAGNVHEDAAAVESDNTTTSTDAAMQDADLANPAPAAPDKPAAKPVVEPAVELNPPQNKPAAEPVKPVETPKPAETPEPETPEPAKPEPQPESKPEDKPAPATESSNNSKPDAEVALAPNKARPAAAGEIPGLDKTANAPLKEGDWNQWAGSSYRNNTPVTGHIAGEWNIGGFDRKTGAWIKDDAEHILWAAQLGSQSYGNPVIAHGKVWVGTNNGAGHLKRYPSEIDLGCLLCFDEKTGEFLWQHSSEKLPTGRVHDWPLQGICCAPYVEGDRLWFVTSRGHVICLDVDGFHDGEDDGPVQGELARQFNVGMDANPDVNVQEQSIADMKEGKLSEHMRKEFERVGFAMPEKVSIEGDESGKKWTLKAEINGKERTFPIRIEGPNLAVYAVTTADDKHEADVIWDYDMMKEMGISQHNMCSCSITALEDTIFVCTGNGVDEGHLNIPAPDAPSFFAMNKSTGDVHWTDKSPGLNILHGQWSSPTVAKLGGVWQVMFAGGDSWLYSFKADRGKDGKPELLWKFDANPKETKYILGGRGTRNEIICTPVVYDGLVYLAVGQDPEHGEGVGHLWCIDPTKRGDVSPQLAVNVKDRSKVIPVRRLQAVIPEEGETAIDNPNSAVIWHYSETDWNGDGEVAFEETMHRTIGTAVIKDDILYIADFSGLFHCVDAKTGRQHWSYDMLAASWGSALIADGKVYIGDEDGDISVFKHSKEKQEEPMHEISMGNSVYSTPVVANGVLYIANRTHLFAIKEADGK